MDNNRLAEIEKRYYAESEPARKSFDEAIELLELAKLGLNPKKPQPTYFTIKDGGEWIEWHNRGFSNTKVAAAIKFDNGAIFDMVNGWRDFGSEGEKSRSIQGVDYFKCSKCTFACTDLEDYKKHVCLYVEQKQDDVNRFAPDATTISNDKRVVDKALLDQCLKILEAENRFIHTGEGSGACLHQIIPLISQLRAALKTEKSELQSPSPRREVYDPDKVCDSYKSMWVNGKCANCGYSEEVHIDKINKQKT